MEMIAMLDGLGMNPEYPIGDVDPATSMRYAKETRPELQPPVADGVAPPEAMTSYPLGSLGADEAEDTGPAAGSGEKGFFSGITGGGWLMIVGMTLLGVAVVQHFMNKRSAPQPMSPPMNGLGSGFAEPEMVVFPERKRRKRRKSRK